MTTLSEIIAPHFYAIHQDIKKHGHTHYWLNGGRGSTKSSFIGIEIPLLIIKNPLYHAVVMRKVSNTLSTSVFTQLQWAIEILGVSHLFKVKTSPLEMTYAPTGQKIYFRGLDDKSKIKSIKPPFGYIAIAWYEELDQFSGDEEIRSVNQSLMRGGNDFYMFYSYNPPKSRDNWVNVEVLEDVPGRLCHKSDYRTVPVEWLGSQFIFEAKQLMERKPELYNHEYLGEVTGTGGQVFDNVIERIITQDEIKAFDRFYYGLDFGFAIDPASWGKFYFDKRERVLYVLDEIYEQRMSNITLAGKIKEKHSGRITADSASPKDIKELKDLGVWVDPAKKGAGSIEHGLKFLQDLTQIVIDKRRTPNAYREFTLYEYQKNARGEYVSAYPDHENHFLDCTRYALEMLSANTVRLHNFKI